MFIYLPAFAGFLVYLKIEYETYNGEPLMTIDMYGRLTSYMIFATVVFYILQKRELKRFLQQQDILKKEQLASKKE